MYLFFMPVKVVQEKGAITISGIPAKTMREDISRLFDSKRLTNNIFRKITGNGFVIDEFFALELYYILQGMIDNPKRRLINIRLLKDLQTKLKLNTWLKNIDQTFPDRLNFEMLKEMTLTPMEGQLAFMKTHSQAWDRYGFRGSLLAGTAGSGKTFTTLATAHCLGAERVVVVCPKNAVNTVWTASVIDKFKNPQTYWTAESGLPYKGQRFAIFHYETVDQLLELQKEFRNKKLVVILDESHNLADLKALRTQRFVEFCLNSDSKDIIYASGTSFKASSVEAIPIFTVIDPRFNRFVAERFKAIFKGNVSKATEILANRINNMSTKITKQQLNLAEPYFYELPVKMPNGEDYTLASIAVVMEAFIKERVEYYKGRKKEDEAFFYEWVEKAYQQVLNATPFTQRKEVTVAYNTYLANVKAIIKCGGDLRPVLDEIRYCSAYEINTILPNLPNKEIKDKFKDVRSVVKYVRLKIQGECLGRVLGGMRIKAHVDMAAFIDYEKIFNSTERKTVVFTSFIEVAEAVVERLKGTQFTSIGVYGKLTGQLTKSVEIFGRNPEVNPLVATFASLSTAVPLVMADTMILVNVPFRNYVLEQAVSRIHRLGQTSQTVVWTAILDTGKEPNISSRNIDILKWSQEQVEKILQIESPFKLETAQDGSDTVTISTEMFQETLALEDDLRQEVLGLLPMETLSTEETHLAASFTGEPEGEYEEFFRSLAPDDEEVATESSTLFNW